jgi:hypothetical protein
LRTPKLPRISRSPHRRCACRGTRPLVAAGLVGDGRVARRLRLDQLGVAIHGGSRPAPTRFAAVNAGGQEGHLPPIQEGRLLLIQEGRLLLIQEGHLLLIQEGHLLPIQEGHLLPIQEGHLLPIQEGHLLLIRPDRVQRRDWV